MDTATPRAGCSRLPVVRAESFRLRRPRGAGRRRGRGPEHLRRLRWLRRGGPGVTHLRYRIEK